MPTIQVLKNTLLQALNLEIAADPGVLERNLGYSNYGLMERTCRRLRLNDQGWHLLGKTADRDGAKYVPPDWRPLTVRYMGQSIALAGVSHDVLFYTGGVTPEANDGGPYPSGVQFDCLGSANYWDTPLPNGDRAFVNGSAIPAHEYRPHNPPVVPGQWVDGSLPVEPPKPPAGIPPFPPRNETFEFGKTLNKHYGSKGVDQNGTLGGNLPGEPRYTDLEGEIVWMSEYLRLRQLGDSDAVATTKVLKMVDDAWPK